MHNLQELLKEKESAFESIKGAILKRNEEIAELENELCRIQGEYRLLCELIGTDSESVPAEEVEAEIVK